MFTEISWLVHGFSTRHGGFSEVYGGGALNLALTEQDTRENVERNRDLLLRNLAPSGGARCWSLVTIRQVHSSIVRLITSNDLDAERLPRSPVGNLEVGDGMLTNQPGLLLGIKNADCLPVLLVDVRRHAVAALHAGWRGTVARIAEKGIGEMKRCFGTEARDLRAAIGPGIHRCCYEVGDEVREAFRSQFDYADELFTETASSDEIRRKYPLLFLNMRAPGHGEPPKKLQLDLVEANRRQLVAAGVAAENIAIADFCTSCRKDLLFSHRAERGNTGRMLAVIGTCE
jgi:YfiH family protein